MMMLLAGLTTFSGESQGVGALTLSGATTNLSTNISRCTLSWITTPFNGAVPLAAKGYNIVLSLSGVTSPSVQNLTATFPTSISPAGFTSLPANVSIGCSSVTLTRISGTPFAMPTPSPYTNLVILSFRAAPGTSLLVTATGMVIPVNGPQKNIAAPAPLSFTVTGTELYGTVTKPPIPGWLPCVNGGTNGFLIPGVTITKNMEIPGACPPGTVNTSQFFFDGIYSFPNNVPSFEYRLTPGKSANGTDMFLHNIRAKDTQIFLPVNPLI